MHRGITQTSFVLVVRDNVCRGLRGRGVDCAVGVAWDGRPGAADDGDFDVVDRDRRQTGVAVHTGGRLPAAGQCLCCCRRQNMWQWLPLELHLEDAVFGCQHVGRLSFGAAFGRLKSEKQSVSPCIHI